MSVSVPFFSRFANVMTHEVISGPHSGVYLTHWLSA